MKKLLLLGTSLSSVEIVQTAKRMGCYTVVTDSLSPEVSLAKMEADEYWMFNTNDIAGLAQKCKEEKIDAIFAGVSEFNLDRVKQLSDILGLPCYFDNKTWRIARNKKAFKNKCKEFGIPVVEEYEPGSSNGREVLERITYPVVVKPVDGTGNKGVAICQNEEELAMAYQKALAVSQDQDAIVERYVCGHETWNYYFLADKEIRYVYSGSAFKEPGYPSYLYSFATSAIRDIREYEEELSPKCIRLLKDIGCRDGIAWIQFIEDGNGNHYALEMAHRMSADTSGKTLGRAIGCNVIEWMLETALGKKHSPDMLPAPMVHPYRFVACVYYIFSCSKGVISSIGGVNELNSRIYTISFTAHMKAMSAA